MRQTEIFPVGVPAEGQDVVDREGFIAELVTRLAERHSVVLAGPRRTGKTSVAREVLRRLRQDDRAYTAEVDLAAVSSLRGMAEALAAACLENVSPAARAARRAQHGLRAVLGQPEVRARVYEWELSLVLRPPPEPPDALRALDDALEIPERMGMHGHRRFTVAFDEFQLIGGIGPVGVLARMRSAFQRQHHTSFLFLGSHSGMMAQLFGARNQPFFRYATLLTLPPVPPEAWREYIRRRFAGIRVSADEAALDAILDQTGGHPYDTMRAAYEAHLLVGSARRLDPTTALAACARVQTQLGAVFDAEIDAVGARARAVLGRIAKGESLYGDETSRGTVAQAVKQLLAAGLLVRRGRGRYEITEAMLARYLRER